MTTLSSAIEEDRIEPLGGEHPLRSGGVGGQKLVCRALRMLGVTAANARRAGSRAAGALIDTRVTESLQCMGAVVGGMDAGGGGPSISGLYRRIGERFCQLVRQEPAARLDDPQLHALVATALERIAEFPNRVSPASLILCTAGTKSEPDDRQ